VRARVFAGVFRQPNNKAQSNVSVQEIPRIPLLCLEPGRTGECEVRVALSLKLYKHFCVASTVSKKLSECTQATVLTGYFCSALKFSRGAGAAIQNLPKGSLQNVV
jgi:hypothetical protein